MYCDVKGEETKYATPAIGESSHRVHRRPLHDHLTRHDFDMDGTDLRNYPPRREWLRASSHRPKENLGRFRVGLSPMAATVLLGSVVLLTTVGLLRVLVPTDVSGLVNQAAESTRSQSSDPADARGEVRKVGGEPNGMSGDTVASELPSGDEQANLVVFVTGAVAEPGLVEVPFGSRLDVAISAVGGLTDDADVLSVNLARPIQDGEHVHVLTEAEVVAGSPHPAVGTPVDSATSPCVDLNTADQPQLETLDGVGPKMAGRILEWREENGSFQTNEELLSITGIGPKLLARISEGLCGG